MSNAFSVTTSPEDSYKTYIFKSRHSKWSEVYGRREHWDEAIDRYLDAMFLQAAIRGWQIPEDLKNEIRMTLINKQAVGSMRSLKMAGPALERDNLCGLNCVARAINSPKAFSEICYLLMLGCGVGFSVERQFINDLPILPDNIINNGSTNIVVEDTKEGWANAVDFVINSLYSGFEPTWDLSKIRPAGSLLKISGGRASGGDPLNTMLEFIVQVFKHAVESQHRRLNSLECHDIVCVIAETIVSGGTRRSATLSLCNLSDRRMQEAKSGDWYNTNLHRRMANISVAYTERPDLGQFMDEFMALYKSKSGERGFFNRDGIQRQFNATKSRRGESNWLVNPCQPNNAPFITPTGIMYMKDIHVGSSIWSRSGWTHVTRKVKTGIKKVFRFRTEVGWFLGTEEHRIKQNGQKVKVMDAISIDHLSGPDVEGKCLSHNTTQFVLDHTKGVPKSYMMSSPFEIKGLLEELYSQYGFVSDTFIGFKAPSKMCDDVQLMLSSIGIQSFRQNVADDNKYYLLSITHDMVKFQERIGFKLDAHKFALNILIDRCKKDLLDFPEKKLSYPIIETEYIGEEDVFDITVDNEEHTYWSGCCDVSNCGETIIKFPFGGCNLSEAVVGKDTSIPEVMRRVRIATILGTIQASMTHSAFLDPKWTKSLEEEALLGVSLTGIMDNDFFGKISPKLQSILQQMRSMVIATNIEIAALLGINPAKATCLIKPSGSVSKEFGVSPGIHGRVLDTYIGNIIGTLSEPITHFLMDQGVPWQKSVTKPSTEVVFQFPISSPPGVRIMKDIPALEQLELVKFYRDNWCDGHNVSCTIHLREHEWFEAGAWVRKNWNDICGITFFPSDDNVYKQAPYQKATAQEWEDYYNKFPKHIDWNALANYEKEDYTVGQVECAGGTCAFDP